MYDDGYHHTPVLFSDDEDEEGGGENKDICRERAIAVGLFLWLTRRSFLSFARRKDGG